MNKTTIQISPSILERLKMLKRHKRESYEEVLTNLLNEYEEETLSDDEIKEIQQGLKDIKEGRTKSIEEVAKELGIVLK
jgi:predicted transcriptional regulator